MASMKTFLPRASNSSERGFSLLELIVVLAIMSLLLSLVSVNLLRSVERAQFIRSKGIALSGIQSLRAQSSLNRAPAIIVTADTLPSDLSPFPAEQRRYFNIPSDITVHGDPIIIGESGFCQGGLLRFVSEKGWESTVTLAPPNCKAYETS